MTTLKDLIQKHRNNQAPVVSYSELEAIVVEVANLAWDKCEISQTINLQDLNKLKKQFIKQLIK